MTDVQLNQTGQEPGSSLVQNDNVKSSGDILEPQPDMTAVKRDATPGQQCTEISLQEHNDAGTLEKIEQTGSPLDTKAIAQKHAMEADLSTEDLHKVDHLQGSNTDRKMSRRMRRSRVS